MNSTKDSLDVNVLRFSWLDVWLVVDGHVVNHVRVWVVATIHALDSATDDVTDLVTVSRVIRDDARVGRCEQWRVAICVLQAFTG